MALEHKSTKGSTEVEGQVNSWKEAITVGETTPVAIHAVY